MHALQQALERGCADTLGGLGQGSDAASNQRVPVQIIEGDQAEYEAWASGEVYGLAVEEFTLTAPLAVDEGGDLIIDMDALAEVELDDQWREVETVWGFVLDAWDEAAVVAEAKEMY